MSGPAINVGRSVSRVGGDAQIKAMKKVAGGLSWPCPSTATWRRSPSFASDLDAASRAQLDRGARLVELLKQPQYSPFPVERQVVSIWAGTNGYLDDVPIEDVGRFEREFLDYIQRERPGVYDAIRETRELSDDTAVCAQGSHRGLPEGFRSAAAGCWSPGRTSRGRADWTRPEIEAATSGGNDSACQP